MDETICPPSIRGRHRQLDDSLVGQLTNDVFEVVNSYDVDVNLYVEDDVDVDAQDNDAAARSMSSSRASSVMGSTSAVRFVQIFSIQIFCYQISW